MKSANVFIYTLWGDDREPLYVGRSSNVARRIRLHEREARSNARKASWFYQVRSVTLFGPYTYDIAPRVEFMRIRSLQPLGNLKHLEELGR